jgi:hypothetical protein
VTLGERKVIMRILQELRAAGYAPVAVHDGEVTHFIDTDDVMTDSDEVDNPPEEMSHDLTDSQVFAFLDNLDEATLHFTHQNRRTWGNRGCMFVMGNDPDGREVLSDHHYPEGEDFSRILDKITNELNGIE